MHKPVINVDQLEYEHFGKGDKFAADRAPVGPLIGARKLGYAVIRLEPGKRAWPYHAHHVIEEMFFVLSGHGTLRHAGQEYPIRAGDFIASPADPGKYGVWHGDTSNPRDPANFRVFARVEDGVDYWDGEADD